MRKVHLVTFRQKDHKGNKAKLEKHVQKHAAKMAAKGLSKRVKIKHELKNLPRVFVIEDADDELLEDLKNDPNVLSVEEDGQDKICMAQSPAEWSHTYMDVSQFHSRGYTGKGVKVGYIDTGCAPHEDLVYAGTYSAYNTNIPAAADARGHGTKVAGIIGMRNNDKGYVGVAPDCLLYGVKADENNPNSGTIYISAQIAGVDWLVSQGVKIINCSFSGSTDMLSRRIAYEDAYLNHGVLFVCSAGNTGDSTDIDPNDPNEKRYPAAYDFVIAVGCVSTGGRIASYSTRASYVDVSAYGDRVMSTAPSAANVAGTDYTTPSTLYESFNGTSCAAPHVAGLAALYWQMYPSYTADQIRDLIESNVLDYGVLGQDITYGKGMVISPWTSKTVDRATLSSYGPGYGTLQERKPFIFKYVAPKTGQYTFNPRGQSSTPRIDVYDSIGRRLTGTKYSPPVTVTLTEGQTYYIGLYGSTHTVSGPFSLNVTTP